MSRTRRALGIGLALMAVFVTACGAKTTTVSKAAPPSVAAAVVRTGTIAPHESLAGIVAPYQNVSIVSMLAEPVDAVYVQEGDHVVRGQVLARLDTTDLNAQRRADLATAYGNAATTSHTIDQGRLTIAQSTFQVRQAQAAVMQARQTMAKDTTDLSRFTQLLSSGYIAEQTVAQQRTLVANDQQAIRSAQAALATAQQTVVANGTLSGGGLQTTAVQASRASQMVALAQADQIASQIAKATIVSPITGVVVNRNVNPGEYPGTRQLFTLQEVNPAFAVLTASGQQIAQVKTGAHVGLTSPDLPNTRLVGVVAGALNQINPGSTNFTVKVRFDNPGERLRSGQIISGVIALPPVRGLLIPATAFTDSTNQQVLVVRQGVARQTPVTQLASDGSFAVVNGLAAGDTVVSNGSLGITDGTMVAVR
jgi:multidrug efflux pump subunit AcrA (membrane-fusion protein)